MEKLERYVARAILQGTRKKFGSLHADYLEEIYMFNRKGSTTTTGLSVGDSEATRTPIQTDAQPDAASEGTKMPASRYAGKPDSINTGIAAEQNSQVRPVTVQPVDRKTLEGSTPGDFRKSGDYAKSAMGRITNPPGPREQMRGQQDGKHYNEDGKAFRSFPGNLADSDSGN